MGGTHRELEASGLRLALLGVAAATVTATAVVAPPPAPTALLAASHSGVNLTAASAPYQAFQDLVDTVLPALVNTFGRTPTITTQSLLAQIPASLLTDVLNANVGNINLPSLINMLDPTLVTSLTNTVGTGATSSLSTAISSAVSTALTSALSGLTSTTGGSFLSTLQTGLAGALAPILTPILGGVSIPVLGTVSLTTLLSTLGVPISVGDLATTVSNLVAQDLVTQLVTSLTSSLTGAGSLTGGALTNGLSGTLGTDLGGLLTNNLGNLVNPLLQAAGFGDASGNIGVGSLLDLAGLNVGSLVDGGAISVTTAGPAFTLARLLGVDVGWTPGTETAIANSVNSTPYLTLGTDTLKGVLTTNLTAALQTGDLVNSLTPILTTAVSGALSQSLNTALTGALTTALANTVDGTVSSGSTLTTALTTAITTAVGGLDLHVGMLSITDIVTAALTDTSVITSLVNGLTAGAGAAAINTVVTNTVNTTVTNVLGTVISGATTGLSGNVSTALSGVLSSAVLGVVNAIPSVDIGSVRVPIVVGTGFGAFSAGAAYLDVLSKLSSQPGGLDYHGPTSIAGSLTLLPELLLNNAGRANGGVLARFSSLLSLFGINAVTPDVAISSSGGTAVGNTGLALGGANLVPVKVDATIEYQPLSDFAAWPNPVTLLNNLAAGLMPTYILRGVDQATQTSQLITQLESLVTTLTAGGQVNPNIYLTAAANHLPLLEPIYLAGDAANMVGLTPVGEIAYRVGNALSPIMTSLVNLGYSDAYWDPAKGQYQRSLTTAATPVQFGTLPNIDWSQVLPNLATSLMTGLQTAFTGPVSVPNAISEAISLVNRGGSLLNLGTLPFPVAAVPATAPAPLSATAPAPLSATAPTPAPSHKSLAPTAATATGTSLSADEPPAPDPTTKQPAKPKPAVDDAAVTADAADGGHKTSDAGKDKGKDDSKAGKSRGAKSPKPKADAANGDSSAPKAAGDGDGGGRHRAPSSTGGKHRAPESGSGEHAA